MDEFVPDLAGLLEEIPEESGICPGHGNRPGPRTLERRVETG